MSALAGSAPRTRGCSWIGIGLAVLTVLGVYVTPNSPQPPRPPSP